ncbi:MAG: group 1 truncated hemoglobin [Pseudomonadota bacterium]
MPDSLYYKYGGFASISRVVMAFYDRLLDSEEVGPFFDDVDLKKLIDHQTKFIAYLLGGPADYTGDRLAQLHGHLGIEGFHFDEMKLLLSDTLVEHGFSDEDRAAVLDQIEARRAQIVTA